MSASITRWRIASALAAIMLCYGCSKEERTAKAAPAPAQAVTPTVAAPPAEPAPAGIPRETQTTDGTSNAEAAGTGTQLPDAGTKGTNGVNDPERANDVGQREQR